MLNRMLGGMIHQVSTDASFRKKIFQHYFEKNPGVRQYHASFDLMVTVDRRGPWIAEKKRNWRTYHPSVSVRDVIAGCIFSLCVPVHHQAV